VKRDQKFFDMYSLVIGILMIVALLIFVGSMKLSKVTQGIYTANTAEYREAVEDRISPIGTVLMPGEEVNAGEPQVAEAPQAQPVETEMSGPQVYNNACLMCHGSGIGGAPMITDKDAWAPRIAQGKDVLYEHALGGFSGNSGFMPPKGARADLSDDEVRSAVDYMVGEAGN